MRVIRENGGERVRGPKEPRKIKRIMDKKVGRWRVDKRSGKV